MMGWSGPRFAAMLAALAVALLYVVGGLAKLDHRTDLDAFLPRQDPVAQQYEHLTETFDVRLNKFGQTLLQLDNKIESFVLGYLTEHPFNVRP